LICKRDFLGGKYIVGPAAMEGLLAEPYTLVVEGSPQAAFEARRAQKWSHASSKEDSQRPPSKTM
jgi:hypothetical protein